jgi:hypothetical protein
MYSKTEQDLKTVYGAILETMNKMGTHYCQSWWLTCQDGPLHGIPTSKINYRAKLLVERGYLQINNSKTSTSTGTCYELTDKKYV